MKPCVKFESELQLESLQKYSKFLDEIPAC